MIKNITITFLLSVLLLYHVQAQDSSELEIFRSTVSVAGSSQLVNMNNKPFIVQQSIGQSSAIGTFSSGNYVLRQGFIQPPMLSSKVIPEETNLQAVIYPNPVNNDVNITLKEDVKEPVYIRIFDLLGRSVYNEKLNAAQQLKINLSFLASAQYIFLINTGEKQFKANLIKQ
ncbi:T9SS type A sorting domain-containing protein [Lutibacter sp.]|uniref:T9SS type A sorting domain-containing protein n=1 Tax=Lutibacter sp. TaxID=1925666 RepID=UPI003562A18E